MDKTYENQRFSMSRKFEKFSRKAQGLSINVIIIVAIALIVLVVLVAVFTGRMGSFVGGVDESTTCSNSCVSLGMSKDSDPATHATSAACIAGTGNEDNRWLGGKYRDNLASDAGCCCA